MNETESDQNSPLTGADPTPSPTTTEGEISPPAASPTPGSVDNGENSADTEIRTLIQAELAKVDPDQPDNSQAEAATLIDPGDAPAEPPTAWSEADRAYWDGLSPAARDVITRREREFQNSLRTDREIQKVLEPLAQQLDGTGHHVDEYLANLLKADQFIASDPLAAALSIIEKHQLADAIAQRVGGQAPATVQRPDPDDRIAQLERTIAERDQVNEARLEWQAFTAKHTDAENLSTFIAGELQANPSFSYAQAYEATKQKLSSLTGAGATTAAANEAQDIAQATAATNKANVLNLPRGDSGADKPADSGGSLRETIEAAVRSHS